MKKKKNPLLFLLCILSVAFGLICFCVAFAGWVRGTMSAADAQTGFWAGFVFFPIAGFWYWLSIPADHPAVRLQKIADDSYVRLKNEIETQKKTVRLSKFKLSPEGFSYRGIFGKSSALYTDVTHYRSHLLRLAVRAFVNRVPLVSYQVLVVKTPQGQRRLSARISWFRCLQKNAQALSYLEKRIKDAVVSRELRKYETGQRLDFGDLSLQGETLTFAGRSLVLNEVASYGVNERWVSLYTKRPGPEAQAHFKRKKVWNEAVLFWILEKKLKPSSDAKPSV